MTGRRRGTARINNKGQIFIDGRHLWHGNGLVGYMFRGFDGKTFRTLDEAKATLLKLWEGKTVKGRCCEVCGESDPDVIHEHHVIPKNNGHGKQYDRHHGVKVKMCANCHFKAHSVFGGYRYKAYTGPMDRESFVYKMREVRGQYAGRERVGGSGE